MSLLTLTNLGMATGSAAAFAALALAGGSLAARRQRRLREDLLARVRDGARRSVLRALAVADPRWGRLPPPVARHLRWALPGGSAPVRLATLRQAGRLRTGVQMQRWMRFDAVHTVAPGLAAFVWDARVDLVGPLHLRVLDSLVGGRGAGKVLLMSAFTMARDGGTPEMNAGSLHRFLAEAVWYPTALVPGEHLRWTALDDGSALATLRVDGCEVSLTFRFRDSGEVAAIHTPARWGRFDGRYRQLPWEGHFQGVVEVGGLRVPHHGEVGWYADGRWEPVWEGAVSEAVYDRA